MILDGLFCDAIRMGVPDTGSLTLTEMADCAGRIRAYWPVMRSVIFPSLTIERRFILRNRNTAWAAGVGVGDGIVLGTTDGTTWTVQTIPANSSMWDVSFVDSHH